MARGLNPNSLVKLHVLTGELSGKILSNSSIRQSLALQYNMDIEVHLEVDTGEWLPSHISLKELDFEIKSWRELVNKIYNYSLNPKTEIQEGTPVPNEPVATGALIAQGQHYPLKATQICFEQFDNTHKLATSLTCTVDFTPYGYSPVTLTFNVPLVVDGVVIQGDINQMTYPDTATAETMARKFLQLDDYQSYIVDDVVIYVPIMR